MLHFTLEGRVVHGKHLGTRLGFPTANICYDAAQGKNYPDGVFIALAQLDGGDTIYPAIVNKGHHPTTPKGQPTIEVHLLGYGGGDLYGRTLRLSYQQSLRHEQKFSSLQALREQLSRDREQAAHWAVEHGYQCLAPQKDEGGNEELDQEGERL